MSRGPQVSQSVQISQSVSQFVRQAVYKSISVYSQSVYSPFSQSVLHCVELYAGEHRSQVRSQLS